MDGVEELLNSHPDLSEISELKETTVAFVAGYIAHLVMDETWINDVFRPFFGEKSPLGGDSEAKIKDRALQFALDLEKRKDRGLMSHVAKEVQYSDSKVEVNFIDEDSLSRWRLMMVDLINLPPDWSSFSFVAAPYLLEAGIKGEEDSKVFEDKLPELVEETKQYLTEERIQGFFIDSQAGIYSIELTKNLESNFSSSYNFFASTKKKFSFECEGKLATNNIKIFKINFIIIF